MQSLPSVKRLQSARRGWALIDVIIGGVILGIGLAAVISIAERSLAMQQRSERELVAAQLLDGLLNEVLAVGVVEWQLSRAADGAFDAPFDKWQWQLDIQKRGLGDPYTDEEISKAPAELEGKTEQDAVIAYLQGMGTQIKARR